MADLRRYSRRPDQCTPHHANELSRPIKRTRSCASAGTPSWLAPGRVDVGTVHVATRPWPLPGRRWLARASRVWRVQSKNGSSIRSSTLNPLELLIVEAKFRCVSHENPFALPDRINEPP